MDRVRVLRLLEYEGPREWVESTLSQNAIKGTRNFGPDCHIREGMIGSFPVVVEQIEEASKVTEKEYTFMTRFGWDFETTPVIKRELQSGKVVAHEGDETWDWDLKVAGE